jgi:hypothetical protein
MGDLVRRWDQCGDGTICRAAGFVLTGIKLKKSLLRLPGRIGHAQDDASDRQKPRGSFRQNWWLMVGPGHATRRISDALYLFSQSVGLRTARAEGVPCSEIERRGAGMYRGIARRKQAMAETPSAAARQRRPHAPSQVVRPPIES